MSSAPSHSPHRHDRSHLRVIRPDSQALSRFARKPAHVTALDAAAVLAALYVAVLMIRFLAW